MWSVRNPHGGQNFEDKLRSTSSRTQVGVAESLGMRLRSTLKKKGVAIATDRHIKRSLLECCSVSSSEYSIMSACESKFVCTSSRKATVTKTVFVE